LLRSEQVRTYPGKWAGISGSLENNHTADEQAIIEIEEETGLSRKDISLIKKGEPFIFHDAALHVKKIIYPYLFHIEDRTMVKMDWEHKQLQWIHPEDIDNYDTMPRLKETLAQVLP
jgi:8-oxo-dGTP pyrophosphatase MutT (NUDIX family)